jgi:hypothetical protein
MLPSFDAPMAAAALRTSSQILQHPSGSVSSLSESFTSAHSIMSVPMLAESTARSNMSLKRIGGASRPMWTGAKGGRIGVRAVRRAR